jgi:hypothetical protein
MRRFAEAAFSWTTLTLGVLLGLLMTVDVGGMALPGGPGSSDWLVPWFEFAGVCLLGTVFLAASIIALRNRRRAGTLLLASAPIVALCFAYSGSVFEVTGANGSPDFYLPRLSRVVMFWLLFFLPFLVPLLVKRRPKRALVFFLILAAAASVAFRLSPWSWPMFMRLLGIAALFSVFGGIWLGTGKLGWPPLLAPKPRSLARNLAIGLVGCLLFASLDIAATFGVCMLPLHRGFNVDCRPSPPFAQPVSTEQAVFTARLIRVGHDHREFGAWTGPWAIGRIQERFWGLRWPTPHLILLTDNNFLEGQTYFVDGASVRGLLTRFLPIVDAGPYGCNRTALAAYATVELHLLHKARPSSETRILGYAREAQPLSGWTAQMPYPSLAGTKVTITGSTGGATTVTTDKDGIYEADGLPPDDYTISLAVPTSHVAEDARVKKESMIQRSLIERDFNVFWNGVVEGRAVDSKGNPAHVWALLLHSDGKDLGPHVRYFSDSDKNGIFRIERVPPGTYKLTINPYGPSDDSPYAPIYYPSAARRDDAGTLQVVAGQPIEHLDFVVNALPKRTLEVRATWPGGKPAEGAWVFIAYEDTLAYNSPLDAFDHRIADRDGIADLHVFGDSRIRVFAEAIVDDNTVRGSARFSAPVELDAAKLPPRLKLVVSASNLPHSP